MYEDFVAIYIYLLHLYIYIYIYPLLGRVKVVPLPKITQPIIYLTILSIHQLIINGEIDLQVGYFGGAPSSCILLLSLSLSLSQ